MVKKILPFLMIAFIITACATSSPQARYAAQMEPAIEQLAKWKLHYAKIETLFADPVTAVTGDSITRGQMIELYNMATEYQITREDYVSLGFSPLDILVGESNKFAREGQDIQDILSAVAPDENIQMVHQAVLDCVQTRSAIAIGLAAALRDLTPVDLSVDESSCSTFDADLEKLTAYVNENK